MDNDYFNSINNHYSKNWGTNYSFYLWDKGPIEKLPAGFRVLEFHPSSKRDMWTYATCGMSQANDLRPIELHLFSSIQDRSIVELFSAIVYYHNNTKPLDLHHTVNFGRPWQDDSVCEYGFISLPFLDGPELEDLSGNETDVAIKFYWLIPVTESEVIYKSKFGVAALEKIFDQGLDYLNPLRKSLITT